MGNRSGSLGTIEGVIAAIRRRVPGFPEDFETRIDEPLRNLLSPGQMQNLAFAAQILLPDLDRNALLAHGVTGRTLWELLERVTEFGGEDTPGRFSASARGTYASANAALRPVNEGDVETLYYSCLEPRVAHRWRFRGVTPSPEMFRHTLFGDGVLAQFMVTPRDNRPYGVGLVIGYAADQTSGHCYIAVQRADHHNPDPSTGDLLLEGTLQFIAYLFDHFNFRKLYFELPEYNLRLVEGWAGTILKEEGRLRDHYYYGERWWDQVIYALYRDEWDEVASLFRTEWPDR